MCTLLEKLEVTYMNKLVNYEFGNIPLIFQDDRIKMLNKNRTY
jgi:hypothetical protein